MLSPIYIEDLCEGVEFYESSEFERISDLIMITKNHYYAGTHEITLID